MPIAVDSAYLSTTHNLENTEDVLQQARILDLPLFHWSSVVLQLCHVPPQPCKARCALL